MKMSTMKVTVPAVAAACLFGVLALASGNVRAQATGYSGRFQIVPLNGNPSIAGSHLAMRVDTETGKTWLLVAQGSRPGGYVWVEVQ